MPCYYATICSGLEFVAESEIAERFPKAKILASILGKVIFEIPKSENCDGNRVTESVMRLRSVNRMYACVGHFTGVPTDESGLAWLRGCITPAAFDEAVENWRRVKQRETVTDCVTPRTFRVTARRIGEHAYTSNQIAAAVGAEVVTQYGWKVDLTHSDIEVHIHVSDADCIIGIPLTEKGLHHRNRIAYGRTSLSASVAYALLFLAQPFDGMVFVDPMCGTATIPIEAALGFKNAHYLCGELDAKTHRLAKANLEFARVPVHLFRWDARRMPLKEHSIDRVVSNLPFGRRVGSRAQNQELYRAFISELARVLKPGGHAVLLTEEHRLMIKILKRETELRLKGRYPINVGGLWPEAFHLVHQR